MGEKKKQASRHQALYRKYRSKSLNEVKGQEHITKTLDQALKQKRLSHAYLFTGPRGTGKTSVARILAHEINGLPYNDESTHLDIIEIDAASNRRIDDIRELRDKVHIAPVSARYKVYIIDEVHMLTTESFNALLKTLEEPPQHVIFILATTEVHKLPATIISRTQRHSFRFIPEDKVVEHLAHIAQSEGIKIEDDALRILAQHGGGSFRDSISLLDQLSTHEEVITTELVQLLLGLAPKSSMSKLLDDALAGNAAAILTELEALTTGGLTPSAIALQLSTLIREKIKAGQHSTAMVQVLSDLLSVHGAQFPQLVLETSLLKLVPATKEVPPIKPSNKEPEAAVVVEQPPQQSSQLPEKEQPQPTEETETPPPKKRQPPAGKSNDPKDIRTYWPAILEATKQKNNPLYTVLRLATPELEADELVLIFSFPFHQKKIDEIKHKNTISEIVLAVTGQAVAIKTVVDKSRAKQAAAVNTAPDPAHASLISNVQDIMGGGEVVNV